MSLKRRDFLRLTALAGGTLATACGLRKDPKRLLPHLVPPDDGFIPGLGIYVKTSVSEAGYLNGVMAKVHEKEVKGRLRRVVTKLEGLPGHPVNDGKLSIQEQAAIYRLYSPGRVRGPLKKVGSEFKEISWEDAVAEVNAALKSNEGKRNVYLSSRTTGTIDLLYEEFSRETGVETLPRWEVYSYHQVRRAGQMVHGTEILPRYRYDRADMILTLGANLFDGFLNPVEAARLFSKRPNQYDNWFHIESGVSLTGNNAQHRIEVRPGGERLLLQYLAVMLDGEKFKLPPEVRASLLELPERTVVEQTGVSLEMLRQLLTALRAANHPLLIAAGSALSGDTGLATAVLTAVVQEAAGMIGDTVEPGMGQDYSKVGTREDLARLVDELEKNRIGVIFLSKGDIIGSGIDPTLKAALSGASARIGLFETRNATTELCDIVLPLSNDLESWGDVVPRRGVRGIIQPAMEPLFDSRSEGDILLDIMGKPEITYKDYLFSVWNTHWGSTATEKMIEDGFIEERVSIKPFHSDKEGIVQALEKLKAPFQSSGMALVIVPSPRTGDGRSRDLELLNDIPDPLSTVTYGDFVFVSNRSGIKTGTVVRIQSPAGNLMVPAVEQPGLASDRVMIYRDMIKGLILPGETEEDGIVPGISVTATRDRVELPVMSGSPSQHGRGLIPMPIEKGEVHHKIEGKHTLYPELKHGENYWGMTINLDACTGCSACVAACYVENNVPVTSVEEHLKGREMSWLRIEPYYDRPGDRAEFLPMLCQQCDNAPCEPVCPVYATTHSADGLNQQTYNRCVGTRYCANNCPYKVRRFNWFDPGWTEEQKLMLNPNVFARTKGIMEKCSFCVQRIRQTEIDARNEKRPIRDGEVVPACAQTCPTDAITFGNMKDKRAKVNYERKRDEAYRVLEELGVEPSVWYIKDRKKV